VLLATALFACGCGGGNPVKKVTGTVTLDNKPLAGAEVLFWPDNNQLDLGSCQAVTGPDGKFVAFPDPRFGITAKPGRYVALVVKYSHAANTPLAKGGEDIPRPAGDDVDAFKGRNVLPDVYNDKKRSPFKVEIKAGDNDFPLALSTHPKF
jgi:hypothetical protein